MVFIAHVYHVIRVAQLYPLMLGAWRSLRVRNILCITTVLAQSLLLLYVNDTLICGAEPSARHDVSAAIYRPFIYPAMQ